MTDTAGKTDWLKITKRILLGICATGAVVASFVFITELALQTGWPPWVAWLLPLCIDALGAMALLQYRTTRDLTAAHVGIGAIAFSALCNAASHWYSAGLLAGNEWFSAGMLTPGFVITTAVGTVPAVSLGICVHLITKEPTHAAGHVDRTTVDQSAGGDTGTRDRGSAGDPVVGSGVLAVAADGTRPVPRKKAAAAKRVSADRTAQARRILDNDWLDKTWDELAVLLPAGRVQAGKAKQLAATIAESNGHATLVK